MFLNNYNSFTNFFEIYFIQLFSQLEFKFNFILFSKHMNVYQIKI